jgi:hypothetical protein
LSENDYNLKTLLGQWNEVIGKIPRLITQALERVEMN